MSCGQGTVHVVDDDACFGDIVLRMLAKLETKVNRYQSAEIFLDTFDDRESGPHCLLLDMRMKGMSGLALMEKLQERNTHIPVIFITGFGDVATAVAAMKAGAVDFLEKPLDSALLVESVRRALARDVRQRFDQAHQSLLDGHMARLSTREKEVMQLLLDGCNSKQIAARLGISPKTAMKHRSHVLEKFDVDSVVQPLRLIASSSSDRPESVDETSDDSAPADDAVY